MLKANPLVNERVIAGLGVIVCCCLLLLAVPRFVASLYALYPDATLKQMQEDLPAAVYEKSIAHLALALSWHEKSDYWQSQAIIYLTLSNKSSLPAPEKRLDLLKTVQASIIQGLKLSPVDPYGWFRLAAVDSLLKSPQQQIINALRLSFYAGRVEPELVLPRLAFSYIYYPEFNEEMQALWKKQLPVAWAFQPQQLVSFIALHTEAKSLVKEALANAPDDWKKFSLALEIVLKKNP